MGYILSCTTTPKRIDYLIQLITNIKPKYKLRKRYKAPNFEDSFKEKKKPFRYIG